MLRSRNSGFMSFGGTTLPQGLKPIFFVKLSGTVRPQPPLQKRVPRVAALGLIQ